MKTNTEIDKLLFSLSEKNTCILTYYTQYQNGVIEKLEDCMLLIINHLAMENDLLKDELVKAKQKMCPGIFFKEIVDNYEKATTGRSRNEATS